MKTQGKKEKGHEKRGRRLKRKQRKEKRKRKRWTKRKSVGERELKMLLCRRLKAVACVAV